MKLFSLLFTWFQLYKGHQNEEPLHISSVLKLKDTQINLIQIWKEEMSLFRSDPMGYYNLMMPREDAWEVLNELGSLDSLQFVDLNAQEAVFARAYSNYIKRCDEVENKLAIIEQEMGRFKRTIYPCEDLDQFLIDMKNFLNTRNRADHTYFEDVESLIDDKIGVLRQQVKTYEDLVEKYNHLIEYKQVLKLTKPFIGESFDPRGRIDDRGDHGGREIKFNYMAGVIDTDEAQRFKRILFRVTRSMAWTTLIDIKPPEPNQTSDLSQMIETSPEGAKKKTVFMVVYQSGAHDMMKTRLEKLCDSFGASKYGIPEDARETRAKEEEIENQLKDARGVISNTKTQVHRILDYFSISRVDGIHYSYIAELKLFIKKEKAIYHNLNMFRLQSSLYQGSCWCPINQKKVVEEKIAELKKRKPHLSGCDFKEVPFPENAKPPTLFRTNEFTFVFQEIVNTYGVPRYGEVNPGLFTIATFPFMFGVMFGDIGHGAIILATALYMYINKEQIEKDKNSFWRPLLLGRHLLLLEGFFATYSGLIYNDFMALPLNLFGSCYVTVNTHPILLIMQAGHSNELMKQTWDCNYPFGIDPGWYGTKNELTFLNSFKMKLAIVLGVAHMIFGILLKGVNSIHFGLWVDFIFEFIPQLVFMSLTFGYMVVLIIIKWMSPWQETYDTSAAPSIIGIFIKMALTPGQYLSDGSISLYGDSTGNYQAALQLDFLLIALVCVPLILLPKVFIGACCAKRKPAHTDKDGLHQPLLEHDEAAEEEEEEDGDEEGDEEEEGEDEEEEEEDAIAEKHEGNHDHDVGELFVHQLIETIEFVLGTVSNTASYLRLWALSLAHSQLAKVAFDNTIGAGIISGNIAVIYIGFIVLAEFTIGILCLMDHMECFLHAVRLHWQLTSQILIAQGGVPEQILQS